jgi:opacity protein-like surface antigen
MKTKIILSALMAWMIIMPLELNAQFKPGIHGAGNLETQAELGELWNNCKLYQGFMLGGTLEYQFSKNISLQTELNYQKKGEKLNSPTEGDGAITKREFNYLSVPLLVKETLNDAGLGEKWAVSFFAGPYGGYLLSANSKISKGNDTSTENIDRQAEKSDFGALFGGGVIYKLNSGAAISAELRYEMGLSRIDKNDKDLRNKGIGITVGYRF